MWRLFVFIYIRSLPDIGAKHYAPGKKLHNKGGIMFSARILGTYGGAGTPSPGRLSPLRAGVLNQMGVCGRLRRPLSPIPFSLISVRWGVREFAGGIADCNLTAKGGNGGCWAGQLCWTAEQVPFPSYRAKRVGAFLTGLTGWRALINPADRLLTALPAAVCRMTAFFPSHRTAAAGRSECSTTEAWRHWPDWH